MAQVDRDRLIAGLYLTAQVTIPLIGWLSGSSYLGWRMFSEIRLPPEVVVTRTASVDTVSVDKFLGFGRADISYGPNLPAELCRLVPDAVSIRVLLPSHQPSREIVCPPPES